MRAEGTVLWTPARVGQDWVVATSLLDFLGSQRVQAGPDMAEEALCPLLSPGTYLSPLHTRSQAQLTKLELARMTFKF